MKNIFPFFLWMSLFVALKVGKIQYCYWTGNSSWKLNNSSWKLNNSSWTFNHFPCNIRCAKKRWFGIRMIGKKVIWALIYLCFFRFSRNEIKQLYRLFKTECPSGCLTEEKFHAIFTSFFPWGDDPYQSKSQLVFLPWQAEIERTV